MAFQKDGKIDWESVKADDLKRADEFAPKGSVKHFALQLGFFPNNEEDAKAILKSCVEDAEKYQDLYERYKKHAEYLETQIQDEDATDAFGRLLRDK